jgi:hypothetical protein
MWSPPRSVPRLMRWRSRRSRSAALADEYDAPQERGELRKEADNQAYSKRKKLVPRT